MKNFFDNISSQMNDLTKWLHITALPPKVVSTIHQRAEEKYNYLNNEQNHSLSEMLSYEELNQKELSYNFFAFNKDIIDSIPFPEVVTFLLEEDASKILHNKLIPLKELSKPIESVNQKDFKNSKEIISNKPKTNKNKEKSNFDLNKITKNLDEIENKELNKENKKIKFSVKKKLTKAEIKKDYSNSEINIEHIGVTLVENSISQKDNLNIHQDNITNETIVPLSQDKEIDDILAFREELKNETKRKEVIENHINEPEEVKDIHSNELMNQKTFEILDKNTSDIIQKNISSNIVEAPIENKENNDLINNEDKTDSNSIEPAIKEIDLSIPAFLLEPSKKINEETKEVIESHVDELDLNDSLTADDNEKKKDISYDKFKEDMKEKRRKLYTQANGLPDIKAKREKFKLYQQQKESMYKQAVIEFLKDNPHIFEKYGKDTVSWEEIEKMAVDSSKSSE